MPHFLVGGLDALLVGAGVDRDDRLPAGLERRDGPELVRTRNAPSTTEMASTAATELNTWVA
jgi:hypothetical protein